MQIVRSNRLPRWLHLPTIALIFTAVLASTVSAQSLGALDRQRGHIMLKAVRKDLERNYYDPTFGGIDLSPRWTEADQQIELATRMDQILGAIAQVPLSLGDSHTLFFPPARTLNAEYGWEMQMVGDTCYVSQVDKKSDAAKQGVRPGDIVLVLNGNRPDRRNISLIRYVLQVLAPQPVLRVLLQSPGGIQRELMLAARVRRRPFIMDLTGLDGGRDLSALLRDINNEERKWIHRYVEIRGEVMVWKMPTFSWSADRVRHMFGKIRDRRALVLDLRGNPGGTEKTMLEMIGGFYAGDTPVATLRSRADSSLLVARGRGDKQFEGNVVVLVDGESASAAEMFARVVQLTKRGTVVGDRTMGAVMRSKGYSHTIGNETIMTYGASVTVSNVVMSDGQSLESHGVVPDEVILPTAEDLAAGRDPVLRRALALVGVDVSAEPAGKMFPDGRNQ
jgi:C-terminal processing protease CtpA/Prc